MSQELKNEADPKGGVWALLAVHFRQSLGAGEGKNRGGGRSRVVVVRWWWGDD